VRFETLEAEDHDGWCLIDLDGLCCLDMIFTDVTIPSIFLIKLFREAEEFKAVLDFRMRRSLLFLCTFPISRMSIKAHEHGHHFFCTFLQYSVVEYKLEGERQMSSSIILCLFTFDGLISYQVIIVLVVRGVLQAGKALDLGGFLGFNRSTILILSLLYGLLLGLDVISVQSVEVSIIHKALFASHGLDVVPDRGMSVHWHWTPLAGLLTTVPTLRQEVGRFVTVIVGVFHVQG